MARKKGKTGERDKGVATGETGGEGGKKTTPKRSTQPERTSRGEGTKPTHGKERKWCCTITSTKRERHRFRFSGKTALPEKPGRGTE